MFLGEHALHRRDVVTTLAVISSAGRKVIEVATRTVRLDDEGEAALQQIRKATGLPFSEVLRRGLQALRERVEQQSVHTPYEVYRRLDLGAGGYSVGCSMDTHRTVIAAIRTKLRR